MLSSKSSIRNIVVLLEDPLFPRQLQEFEYIEDLKKGLKKLTEYHFDIYDNHLTLLKDLIDSPPQFVFNLCDEGYRNNIHLEPHIPSLLELLKIPYSGCDPACLSISFNKSLVRTLAAQINIPVPSEIVTESNVTKYVPPWGFPCLVKPNQRDGSIGINQHSVIGSKSELEEYLINIKKVYPNDSFLIQEYLPGTEYSVGIIGNVDNELECLPIIEVDYTCITPGTFPIIDGYLRDNFDNSDFSKRMEGNEETQSALKNYSKLLFKRLGCSDYARFDFRADHNGQIKLLEANPNPSWCLDGRLNYMTSLLGLSYSDFLRKILEVSLKRYFQM